jgi:hypothetical protein
MASTRSTIEIEIRAAVESFRDATRGAEVQLRRMASAVDDNEKAFDRWGKGIGIVLKAIGAMGAVGNVVGLVAGLTTTIVNLLPAALILPGALVSAAVAMGVFKLATSGVADALGGDADAMAKLAPSARAFVGQINALKPAFDSLRKSVQQKFFENFAGDVKNLSGVYLPILNRLLPPIAEEFNRMGRSITRALFEAPAQDDISLILENVALTLGNARQSLGHFVSGFIGLAAVGSNYIVPIGTAIDGVAFKFKHWVDQGIETGTLMESIERALAGFKLLGEIATNIGGIIAAVFRGLATGPQQDFLTALRDSTQALQDFLNQGDTQGQLGALGQAFATISEVTRTVFLEALRQLFPIAAQLAPVFAEIARTVGDLFVNALRIVGPILLQVATFLNENKTAIGDLAPLVIGLWAAFKGASILNSAITGLRGLSTALGGPINLLKAGGIVALGALAVKLDEINVATAKSEGRPLNEMEDDLNNLVGAGRQLLTLDFSGIFSDIGSEWDTVVTKFQTGESPIGAFFQRLVASIDQTGQSFATIGTFIANFVTTTGQSFATIGTAIATGFTTAVTAVGNFFTVTIPGLVTTGLSTVGTAISTAFTNVTTTVGTFFTNLGTSMLTGATTAWQGVIDFFSQTPGQIGFAIGAAIGDVISWGINLATAFGTAALNAGTQFVTGVQTFLTNAVTFVSELPGRIGAALASLAATLQAKAVEAGTAFLTWLGNLFTDTTTRAQQVPADVGNAVANTATTLRDRAIEAGTQFLTWISNKFTETVTYVNGVPGRIGAAIAEVVPVLLQKAQQAGQSFIDGVTTKFNEAIAYVNGIPGRISAAIGNLGNLLVNAGRSVIDGLLNGIKSGYQSMISFVDGIAAGIAAHKGPLSFDKVVLRPAGLALMDGLLGGIRDGNDDVQRFVSGIAAQLADPFAANLTGSALTVSTLPTPASTLAATAQSQAMDRLISAIGNQAVKVDVMLDGQPFAAMVTTAVVEQDRESARIVKAGGGTSW